MKHNILYVIDALEFGGGERSFLQVIQGLDREQYTIHVACTPGGEFEKKLNEMGLYPEHVSMENRFNPMIILRLADLMKRENVDIVHSQGARADFFARMAARLAGTPIVVSTVPMPVEGFDVNPIRKLIYIIFNRFTERFVDRFIVVSDALRRVMIKRHGIEPQKVVRIYNGVEIGEYNIEDEGVMYRQSRFREELGLGSNTPVIGAIGRLIWQKGFVYLIEAVPEVLKENPEVRFLIVGEGPLENELKAESKKLKIDDKVIFTGFGKDVKKILASIDILVIPSLLEGLPIIILEAMATGKPIVTTDIDGIREQIDHNKNGLLIPPKKPAELAMAIVFLLKNREKAVELAMGARKKVEQFSVEKLIEETKTVYEELLASKS